MRQGRQDQLRKRITVNAKSRGACGGEREDSVNGGKDPELVEGDIFRIKVHYPETETQVTTEVTTEVATEEKLLAALEGEMSKRALKEALALKNDEHFRKAYLNPALEQGLIEMTIPDKPRSSRQRYRVTEKGKAFLKRHKQ